MGQTRGHGLEGEVEAEACAPASMAPCFLPNELNISITF
jgi:hypothetical protein